MSEHIGSSEKLTHNTETDIYLMRHSNRFGGKGEWTDPATSEVIKWNDTEDLTPEGKARAREFGLDLRGEHNSVVGVGSMEGRAAETASDIEEGFGQERGQVNQASGITYKELGPDGQAMLKAAKPLIQAKAGSHPEYGRLSPEERATVRQGAQEVGLREGLKDMAFRAEAAEGLAFNLWLLKQFAEKGVTPDNKVAMPIVNHGLFNESFLLETLEVEDENGKKVKLSDVDDIGGVFAPAEAFKIKIKRNGSNEKVECSFTDPNRQAIFEGKKLSLDWSKVEELFYKFEERMATRENRVSRFKRGERLEE